MKRSIILLTAGVLVFLSSCNLLSLYPLYTREVLLRHDQLRGDWVYEEDSTRLIWRFEAPGEEKEFTYRLTLTEQQEEMEEEYKIHLVKLEDTYYFDVYPEEEESLALTEFVKAHTFARVEFREEEIIYYPFDFDWLKKLFDRRKIRLKHERPSDNRILLTASPEELQKFLIKYGQDENAYLAPIVLKRPV